MTNATKITHIDAIKSMSDARDLSAANKKKAQKIVLLASDKSVSAMLKKAKVDAALFNNRALYMTEKCITSVHQITREHADASYNENALVALKCASLCAQHNAHMRKSDIDHALLHMSTKIDETREHLIFHKRVKISAAAQAQQCIDMLRTLNVAKQITRDTFEIDAESEVLKAFNEKFAQIAV